MSVHVGQTQWKQKYDFERHITVRTQFRGFHAYKDAPDEVAFLKGNHRHTFKVEAHIQVFHDDRELEFFMVQDRLDKEILAFTTMMSNLESCEMMAERIATGLLNMYGDHRFVAVTVSEDGENDGTVTYDPERQNT